MCKIVNEDLIWKRHLDQIIVDKSKNEVESGITYRNNENFDVGSYKEVINSDKESRSSDDITSGESQQEANHKVTLESTNSQSTEIESSEQNVDPQSNKLNMYT